MRLSQYFGLCLAICISLFVVFNLLNKLDEALTDEEFKEKPYNIKDYIFISNELTGSVTIQSEYWKTIYTFKEGRLINRIDDGKEKR